MTTGEDITTVSQLILRERQSRDRGWWDRMRACYRPDSVVRVSWFSGTGGEFVDRPDDMAADGHPSIHRMGCPVVDLVDDRAVAEVSAGIEVRTGIDGVEIDLVSWTRLLVRAECDGAGWRIRRLDGIYERDTLTPAVPGTTLPVDPATFGRFRPTYRCLAWVLDRLGYPVDPDLPGDDRPEPVKQLYTDARAWLDGAGT